MDVLSNEILEHIISYLGHTDIDSCRFTCRRFDAVIRSSVLLRYLYRLHVSGRIDSELHTSNLSVSRRLSMLQDSETAWLRADFTPVSTLRLPNGISHVMSIYGSLYALKNLAGHDFSYGKIMRIDEASLASSDASWQELDLTAPPGGVVNRAVRDIHIVGNCNLLMTVSVEGVADRVHRLIFDFYTADTFEPHPDALRSSIILHCPASLRLIIPGGNIFSHVAAVVAISGDYVLFKVTNWASGGVDAEGGWVKDNIYYCIPWREGILVPLGMRSHAGSVELQFITDDKAILTHADDGQRVRLEICTLARCPVRGCVLQTLLYLQLPRNSLHL
ncbi:hypothetical protein PENSPDRAFT_383030 [Peniophora sp. CONT]|nr:hypothetical protein PENSPDRAFT_383030 [Peniophora sp. CONT]